MNSFYVYSTMPQGLQVSPSKVTLLIDANQYYYTWKKNLDFTNADCSPDFVTEDSQIAWYLRAFKEVVFNESGDYLSISLTKRDGRKIENIGLHIHIGILDDQGNELIFREKYLKHINDKISEVHKFQNIVKIDYLKEEKNKLVNNGEFTVQCKLCIVPVPIKAIIINDTSLSLERRQLQLDDYEKLFFSKTFSDLVLIVENEKFHVHKSVLAIRSTVFSAMLQHDMREKNENTVEIEGIKKEVMREVLLYIYTGKINNIKAMAKDLIITADRYAIEGLKFLCEDSIIDTLDINNVSELLTFADMYKAEKLKTHALKLIVINRNGIDLKSLFKQFRTTTFSLSEIINAISE